MGLLRVNEAPVPDPNTKQRWIEAFELFDVAPVGSQKTVGSLQEAQSSIAVDGTQVGVGDAGKRVSYRSGQFAIFERIPASGAGASWECVSFLTLQFQIQNSNGPTDQGRGEQTYD